MSQPPQESKSRSQIKREFQQLQALGKQLVALSAGQLRAVPLADETREAIRAAGAMTRGALKRQLKRIGSLLSTEDLDAVGEALAGELQPHADQVAAFHECERWRDRLLADDDGALTELVARHPGCDVSRLRQLVRNAKRERELGKPAKSARQLFRFLRELAEPSG